VDHQSSPAPTTYGVDDYQHQYDGGGGHHRLKRRHADDFRSCRSPGCDPCQEEDSFLLPPRSADNPAGGGVSDQYDGSFRTMGDQFGTGNVTEAEFRLHAVSPEPPPHSSGVNGGGCIERDFLYDTNSHANLDIIKVSFTKHQILN